MATLNFPTNPSLNQLYSFGGKTWIWNGSGWQIASSGAINNIPIGNVTPSTGAFTALSANALSANTVTANVISAAGNITGSNLNLSGNLSIAGNVNSALNVRNTVTATGFTTGGTLAAGLVSSSGNVVGTYIIGDGSQLTNLPGTNYSNANVANYLPTYTGNLVSLTGPVTTTGNLSGSNVSASGLVTATGNITGGNIRTAGLISATGNITGGNVATGNLTAGNVSTTGNVTGAYFIGDGSQLTNLPGTNYSNANVANYLPTYTGNLVSLTGPVTTTSNITGGNIRTTGSITATGNVVGGNIQTAGSITATGNITGGNVSTGAINATNTISTTGNVVGTYIIGDGSQLTNLPTLNYSNANVAAYLPTYTGNLVSLTGPVTTTNTITAGNVLTSGLASAAGNVTGGNLLTSGLASITGNIISGNVSTGTVVSGNVSASGIISSIGNIVSAANVSGGNLLTSGLVSATGNIVSAANVSGGNVLTGGLVSATGNIVSAANVTGGNIRTTGLITATGNVTGGNIRTTGIISATGNITGGNISTGDVLAGNVSTFGNVSASGNIIGTYFIGNGSQLTGLPATYSNANVAAYLPTYTGNLVSLAGPVVTTANITGDYIFGNGSQLTGLPATYSNANVAAYLPTYTGNLVSLTGPVTTTGTITGGNINASGTISTSGSVTGNVVSAALLSSSGNIISTGGIFIGNGSGLTGVVASSNVGTAQQVANGITAINIPISDGNIIGNVAGQFNLFNFTPLGFSIAGNIVAAANITGGNVLTGGLISATSTITSAANITGGNVLTAGLVSATGNVTGGNVRTTGLISATGNVTGNYILGNGALLTGVITSVANINNGTSNVTVVSSGGNVSVGVGGTGNVAVFATTGEYVTGLISASGNIIGGNVLTAGLISATSTITSAANITGGNVLTGGLISATGNISGAYFVGNGSQLAGVGTPLTVSQYTTGNISNAISNVSALRFDTTTGFSVTDIGNNSALISLGSSFKTWEVAGQANLVAVGEDVVEFVAGNGISITTNALSTPQQIKFTATYGNGNVTTLLSNLGSNVVSTTGNITGGNILTSGLISATSTIISAANITGGNVLTGGQVSATGNVSGNYILGNGALLTGVITSVANINNGTSNVTVVSSGGNVTVGVGGTGNVAVFASTGEYVTGVVSASGNIIGGNIITSGTGGNITGANVVSVTTLSATGNVTGGNVLTAGLISATGNITGANLLINNDATITGNLVVNGNTTFINSNVITTNDKSITLANNQSTAANVDGAGIDIGNSTIAYWRFNNATTSWQSNIGITPAANATLALGGTSNYWGTAYLNSLNVATTSTVQGNATGGNLLTSGLISATGKITAGAIAYTNTDGTTGQVLTTYGNGTTYWSTVSSGGSVGNAITLGTPTDGNLTGNVAYSGWTTSTYVTDGLDDLNQVTLNVAGNTFVGNTYITANTYAGPSPLSVSLTGRYIGNPNSYLWQFSDGTSNVTTANATHTFSNALGGTYTVTYTAYNTNGTYSGNAALGAKGSTSTATIANIVVYTPTPIPSFALSSNSFNTGNTITITNASTYVVWYDLSFGDGTANFTAGPGLGNTSFTTVNHTYNSAAANTDSLYSVILSGTSNTAGASNVTVVSSASNVKVYSPQTGNVSVTANVTTVINGLGTVSFRNDSNGSPGNTTAFGAQQYYYFSYGDGNISNVVIASGTAGNPSAANVTNTFALSAANQAGNVYQQFTSNLYLYTGYSSSPAKSSNITITVNPQVRANFIGTAANVTTDATANTGNAQVGYIYTDYNNNNRATFTFQNTSQNSNLANWSWGDSTFSNGVSNVGNVVKTYTTTGAKTVALTANGTPNGVSSTAQSNTLSVTGYIFIANNPTAPTNLSGFSNLAIANTSEGTSPLLAAGARDATGGNIVANGTSVTRFATTTTIATAANIVNANTATTGTLNAYVNNSISGNVTFTTSGNTVGSNAALVISADRDLHVANAAVPSYFYKVFNANISCALSSLGTGYNNYKMVHTVSGNTNYVGFVKDNLNTSPSLVTSNIAMVEGTAGTYRYISGIPYYNTGSPTVTVANLEVANLSGQTFRSTDPFTLDSGTVYEGSGALVTATQTKALGTINNAGNSFLTGANLNANIGIGSNYTLGNLTANITGANNTVATFQANIFNVVGTGTTVQLPTKIQTYAGANSGVNEQSITASTTGNTQAAVRIVMSTSGNTPVFSNSTNFYTANVWSGAQTIAGTPEAVVRYGVLKHYAVDLSTGYLPVGPNLSSGRSGTQYFTFAFARPSLANFDIRITSSTGIAGVWIAAPGTTIDKSGFSSPTPGFPGPTSTISGWLEGFTQYAGSGVPGASGTGGNGSNGCALTGADVIPLNTAISNVAYTMTLGAQNAANSTGNNILIRIALASGQTITDLQIGTAT